MQNRLLGEGRGKHPFLLFSLITIITALMYSNFYYYPNYIAVPLLLLWVPVFYNYRNLLNKVERGFVIVSFIILSLELFYWLVGFSETNIGFIIRQFNYALAGVVSIYALNIFSKKETNIFFVLYTGVLVLYLFSLASAGSRLLASQNENSAVTIAGTWMGSMLMLLSGFCLIVFLHVKSLASRIISATIFLLIAYINFFVMQRGTIAIMTIAELAMILVVGVGNRKVNRVFITIFVIVAAIILSNTELIILTLDFMADVIPSERLSYRFQELSLAVQFESLEAGGGSFSARADLIGVSWDTFTSSFGHFLFGAGEHRFDGHIIGNHSFFIDNLAAYGVVGGILIANYFFQQHKLMTAELDKNKDYTLYMQCTAVFLFYVLRNFYGAIAAAQSNFLILLYFPLVISYIKSNNTKIQTK